MPPPPPPAPRHPPLAKLLRAAVPDGNHVNVNEPFKTCTDLLESRSKIRGKQHSPVSAEEAAAGQA